MSHQVFELQVSPSIPPRLRRLEDLAGNFWFSWNPTLGQLFRRLDPVLWRRVDANPRLLLRSVDQSVLDFAATDERFLAELEHVLAAFDRYVGTHATSHDELAPADRQFEPPLRAIGSSA